MKVGGRFHLTYCSSVHRAETWPEVFAALANALPRVRARLGWEGPLAIGLRLSAQAAESLEDPEALRGFRAFLAAGDYYVPTLNGFPYGVFSGQRVKERVYLPDWRDERRLAYTDRLARLLAALLSNRSDVEGTISTVPGAFRRDVRSDDDVEAIAVGILRHAAFLRSLHERTGVSLMLAIEPEPACFVETIAETVDFFTRHLLTPRLLGLASQRSGLPLTAADVRRHVGICIDTCHMAVEFEDPAEAIEQLRGAGIRIGKVQVSAALEVVRAHGGSTRAALEPFAEDVYLHQVVGRRGDSLFRYTDLPDALDEIDRHGANGHVWRVHFHVPIFLSDIGPFRTTQADLTAALGLLRGDHLCDCFEVETYTWDVLPEAHRTGDVCEAIARELAWARAQLES